MDIASLSAISGIENISKYADNSLQTEKSKGSGTASSVSYTHLTLPTIA